MYCSPDFMKVSVKAKDVFASYAVADCYENNMGMWNLDMKDGLSCENKPGAEYITKTYTELDWGHSCYVGNIP